MIWMRRSAFSAALLLSLLWPIMIYGSAGYFSDSSGYYRGGAVALEFVDRKIDGITSPATSTSAPMNGAPKRMDEGAVNGLRSITYSIAAYTLSFNNVDLLPLVVAQALLVTIVLLLFARTTGIMECRGAMAALLALGLLTPVAIFTTLATPDIFAGLMILAALILIFQADRLRKHEKYFLAAIIAAAITAHASHMVLAIGMLAAAAVVFLFNRIRPKIRRLPGRWRWTVLALLVGLATNATMSLVGFGEVSVAPKHYPFALARSIEDGPALWYLNEECPKQKFAVCEFYGDRPIPQSNNAFLFGKEGLAGRANPDLMDRIRAEELAIVQAAIQRYPWHQLQSTLTNVWLQIVAVGISPVEFQDMWLRADGSMARKSIDASPQLSFTILLQRITTTLALAVVLIGIPSIPANLRWMAIWSLIFLLANAAICGGLSAPAPRYQNRVIWVLALISIPIARVLLETKYRQGMRKLRRQTVVE